MPDETGGAKSRQISWMAESLRVTLFHNESIELNDVNWWHELIGEEPENTNFNRKVRLRQDNGIVNDNRLTLGVQPRRIDWLANSIDPIDNFSMGQFETSLTPFQELIDRWLENAVPSARLAFGAILMYPVEDRAAGYRLLEPYLPKVELDPDGSTDFIYQINRPRADQLGIDGLKLNRLSKWFVARQITGRMEVSLSDAKAVHFPESETYACRLQLDINTAAEYQGELPYDQLNRIFNELVELGKEIATGGDTR